jgi:hypothetical protein
MKARFCAILVACFFSSYSQDTTIKKLPVLSIEIRSIYGILPYNYSLGINTNNLKHNFSLTYNSYYNTPFVKRPGVQLGYNFYVFKKCGLTSGISMNYIWGEFDFAGEKAKYEGYTRINNLSFFTLNSGFFYRFKLGKYGIIEPAITVTYNYTFKKLNKDYLDDQTMPKLLLNINVKYYFKRNKK